MHQISCDVSRLNLGHISGQRIAASDVHHHHVKVHTPPTIVDKKLKYQIQPGLGRPQLGAVPAATWPARGGGNALTRVNQDTSQIQKTFAG